MEIAIDRTYLKKLKDAYIKAKLVGKESDDSIMIDGREYVLGYLKYLIEYAESRL